MRCGTVRYACDRLDDNAFRLRQDGRNTGARRAGYPTESSPLALFTAQLLREYRFARSKIGALDKWVKRVYDIK